MAKLLIISDNHFQAKPLADIISRHHDADYFIHCGDSQWLPDDMRLQNFTIVKGNNDFVKMPNDVLLEIAGYKVLVTHGHQQYVYNDGADNMNGTAELVTYAQGNFAADIVLYGHTHVPETHLDRGINVLNPGSTNYPRNFTMRFPTYAIMILSPEEITINFFHAQTHEDLTNEIRSSK